MNTRALAAKTLKRVVYDGMSLTEALQKPKVLELADRDQAFLRDMCFGCLRWHERLTAVLYYMLAKPLKSADKDIECLLHIGLYQLIYQRTPDHASVNESVKAAKKMKKLWAGSLINGVLRSFIREQEEILAHVDQKPLARYSFPEWLMLHIQQAWPQHWEEILLASNEHPPMVIRVNLLQGSADAYRQALDTVDIKYMPVEHVECALRIRPPVPVDELPNFKQGAASIQDSAAQLAATLLDCQEGEYVLDACAAPGGKTCHLLEHTPSLEVLALDNNEQRLTQVKENLQRLQLNARVLTGDAGDTQSWWDGRLFDRILLDAPCSGTGVIRRHPDIKYLRQPEDVANLQQEQMRLLDSLWEVLHPNGYLLYATCSILPEENVQQIERFMARHSNAVHKKIIAEWGRALPVGRQILPGESGMDGFYYALLQKQ